MITKDKMLVKLLVRIGYEVVPRSSQVVVILASHCDVARCARRDAMRFFYLHLAPKNMVSLRSH